MRCRGHFPTLAVRRKAASILAMTAGVRPCNGDDVAAEDFTVFAIILSLSRGSDRVVVWGGPLRFDPVLIIGRSRGSGGSDTVAMILAAEDFLALVVG